MKLKRSIAALLLPAVACGAGSCKKDEDVMDDDHHHTGTGTLRINVVPMFGDSVLDLNTESYVTANGDTLTVSTFRFYLSNIVLTDDAGGHYSVADGYYLVDASSASSQAITLQDIPSEHYTNISFLVGVDSARNVSGSQTGALDPANAMFWTWSSGYIMAKLEGTSPQSSASMHTVTVHIGGFSGANSVLRTVNIPLSTHAMVSTGVSPVINLTADAAEWFMNPNLIDFSATPSTTMPGALAVQIADNYSHMFELTSVQN